MPLANEDRALAFAISDTAQILRKSFNERARHLRLTQAQYRTLIYLDRQQGITQSELARLLEIRPITLTRQLDLLAANQMIERRINPDDRRSFQLYLTNNAEPVLREIRAIGAAMMKKGTQGLSAENKKQLTTMLMHIKDNLMQDDVS
ncbi:MAG: MarR family transcriptional regulator [Robiginitomaculum sp.]|nr:MarR family transcriptional regulator [Robiginitomaculum sp.]MDQ7076560.1 MarR family transcriptional regulator [Robiginitomaculum sp.]